MTYTFQRRSFFSRPYAGGSCALSALAVCATLLSWACKSEDDIPMGIIVSGGSAGMGGSAGSGTAGMGGGGSGGNGDAGPSGPSGTLRVLSTAAELRAPTTAAVRGTDLWVVNGQLSALFGGPAATLPFSVVSLPLDGGAIGATVIELPGNDFYPEGIAAAADGTLYVGSVNLGTVVKVPADSTTASAFVAAGVAERGVVGLTVDDTRDLLWFCDSNPLAAAPAGAIVGISLDTGTEVVRHAMPNPGSAAVADAGAGSDAGADAGDAGAAPPPVAGGPSTFCNDLIVEGTGNIFATDSSGRIFRVPAASVMTPNSAAVWLSVPEISPPMPGGFGANGIDIVGSNMIVANGGGLVAIDPNSSNPASTVRTISLTLDGAPATLCGPDGLQAVPNSTTDLVVVENGGCNPPSGDGDRVVRVTLDL